MPVEGGGRVRVHGLLAAWKRTAGFVALAVLLVLVVYWWLTMTVLGGPSDWAFDFRQFWQGGNDVVNGVSPYPSAGQLDAAGDEFGPVRIQQVFRFPYPAGAAVALGPFGLMAFGLASAVWGALLIASILAAVWILGVRDWRVLAVVISSHPVITSVRLGTLTPLLILLLAVAWRWRDRRWAAGGALAAALALKLFLWPLVIWLVATRRFAAAIITAGLAAAGTLVAWAAIGFEGLTDYPELLRRLADIVEDKGLSLVALGVELGLPQAVAEVLPWVVGLSLLASAVAVARSGEGDRRAFSLAIIAAIALTPIVWLHYFALLVVPLAIARPRIAWAWALMWGFWFVPAQGNEGELWRIVVAAVLGACIAAYCARPTPRLART